MKWILLCVIAVFAIGCGQPSTAYTAETIPSAQEDVVQVLGTSAERGISSPSDIPGFVVDLPDPETLATIARGRITIEIPESLPVERSEIIEVTISREEIEIVEDVLIEAPVNSGLTLHLALEGDSTFNIVPITGNPQQLGTRGATWAWKIDPGDPGDHQLVLIASLKTGDSILTLDIFEQELNVKDTWQHRWKQIDLQIAVGAFAAVSAGILAWAKYLRPRAASRGQSEDAESVDAD